MLGLVDTELWTAIIAALALFGSIWAARLAKSANNIAKEERDTSKRNNGIAEGANVLATEALQLSRNEQERRQRREDELHEVRWKIISLGTGGIKGPEGVVDTHLLALNMGPDIPHDAVMLMYQGENLLTRKEQGGALGLSSGINVTPVDSARIEKELRDEWNSPPPGTSLMPSQPPEPTSSDIQAAIERRAINYYECEPELILRWKSEAGVPHQESFKFAALNRHNKDE